LWNSSVGARNECSDRDAVAVVFTDSAATKVKELIDEEGNPDLKLRGFRNRRRLFGLSVWIHLRRSRQ